jgi:tetratricopeptide (TPR) repeat protein
MTKIFAPIAAFVIGLLLMQSVMAEDYIDLVKSGNAAFAANDFKKALEFYRSAETEIPESPELNYNIAGTLSREGKYEESVDMYTKSLNTTDINLEAQAHYNLGNTYFHMEDYQNAITSYENALKINPNDLDAKFNLELARKRLKEQIKPEQHNQDKQQQQQQEQQQQQNTDEQSDDQKDQQQQDQQDQQDQQQQEQQQQQQQEMTKEDAERILNALKDEQELQKQARKQKAGGTYSGKDW